SLPQNFSGGQNPGIGAGATGGGRSNQNITGGSGLNLRGLGQDASLTLLNGRRMAYGGFVQMVDISALPVEAVDRIEILADGASAIYGSDAVGGVANVILKRDFDGLAASARYGFATDGGLATQDYSATAGATWASGGVIATFKTVSNDPVRADQRSYTEAMFAPSTLYQRGDLYSGLVSAHQALGDRVEIRVDGLLSRRRILTDLAYAATYERNEPTTRTRFIAPNMDIALPHGWLLSIGGAWGKDETKVDYRVITRATGAAALSRPSYDNESITYEVGAEGPMFALGGGDVRLAVGAGYRRNDYLSTNLVSGAITVDGKVSSRFGYGELNLPLIGPDQGIAAVHRLTVTGALRIEDYASLSTVSTPKLGLIYEPTEDVTLKASWGRSFKVPTLSQQFSIQNAILFPAVVIGGSGFAADATALYHVGGNPDLKPERATTWSAGISYQPRSLPGARMELSYFDVTYNDRVVSPIAFASQALSNPLYASQIVDSPGGAQQDALIASAATFLNATGQPYDPAAIVAIVDNASVNAGRQTARGVDILGEYRHQRGAGQTLKFTL
ncbi:MAG: TonB-dependent receptor, partial [Stutzerimonas stutzeri]